VEARGARHEVCVPFGGATRRLRELPAPDEPEVVSANDRRRPCEIVIAEASLNLVGVTPEPLERVHAASDRLVPRHERQPSVAVVLEHAHDAGRAAEVEVVSHVHRHALQRHVGIMRPLAERELGSCRRLPDDIELAPVIELKRVRAGHAAHRRE